MSSLAAVLAVATAYLGLLFALARWAEQAEERGRRVAGNAVVYTLSLATYCTTWTYYGSVGFATSSGLLFLGVYIGPTLGAALWWRVLRKMVRIKNAHRLTSVVDLLSLRYGRSQVLGAAATLAALAAIVPYVALQLKTMIAAGALLTGRDPSALRPGAGREIGIGFVVLLAVFTIAIGIRRLSPAERHPGIVVSAAAEGAVKLAGALAVGAFVTYGLFHGFGDVFRRAAAADLLHGPLGERGTVAGWIAVTFESAIAVVFLPRQFHLAVVENTDERHIRTAMWGLPLYLLAINLFTFPVAMAGLLLGNPASAADTFVLGLPLASGQRALTWLVFLGGLSAGTGMIVCEAVTIATMVSNHLVLPLLAPFRRLAPLRRHLLPVRWAVAALVILAAFGYERAFGTQYELVSMGLVAHTGALVVGLAILVGLYWRGASAAGALAGVGVGLATWGYTLVFPLFVRAGWLPERILSAGPGGIAALRPEALLGIAGLDRIPHAVLWIVLLSGGAFVFVSLLFPAPAEEQARADRLVNALDAPVAAVEDGDPPVVTAVAAKRARIVALLSQYHSTEDAQKLAGACLEQAGAGSRDGLSALQLASLESHVETALAASIGSAAAHAAVKQYGIATAAEERAISSTYARLLATLKVPPADLQRAVDYHRERERILAQEADAQRFLAEVSGRLGASLDLETTGRTVASLPVPHLADAALVWIAGRDAHRPRAWVCDVDPERHKRRSAAVELAGGDVAACPDVAHAMESLRPVLSTSADASEWPEGVFDPGCFAAAATFPLLAGGAPFGTLALFLSERSRTRLSRRLAVCDELSRRSAIALDNAMLLRSAEDAIRAREEFLAVASHEVKTPLTPLRLKLQKLQRLLARRGVSDREIDHAIDGVDEHVSRLVALMDDLSDVSRIARHGLRLSVGPTDLEGAIRGAVERHRADLTRAGCVVSLSLPRGVVGTWDRSRIEQVLSNLLVNASKYAPGRIEVGAEADRFKARVVVRDHGPGIAPDDRARIFEPFERAVSYRRASGFGLGLYIVRRIVEAHGGAVRVESATGDGSTFIVDLPLEPASPDERAGIGERRAGG
jgi:signal transduction histidine kinase/Na+/proline symporter